MWVFSELNNNNIKSVTDMEKKLGINLVAFSNDDTKFAELDDTSIKEIKALEGKLGVSLVALNA
jgi:predicted xylose isomerase-like sugar epimerase